MHGQLTRSRQVFCSTQFELHENLMAGALCYGDLSGSNVCSTLVIMYRQSHRVRSRGGEDVRNEFSGI